MNCVGERVGHVSITTRSTHSAKAVESRLAQFTRAHISNPPAFGARIAAAILGDSQLRVQWDRDLVTMSSRIAAMRRALYEELLKLGEHTIPSITLDPRLTSRFQDTPGDWKHVLEQKGMFCILGLNVQQVMELRGNYAKTLRTFLPPCSKKADRYRLLQKSIIFIWPIAREYP